MFTALTIAMTLSGAVALETPAIKTEAGRPALVELAANFGKGNISSGNRNTGNRERRFGKRFDNGGPGIFGANLAEPPGGNKPFGNAKGSNAPAPFGNGVGSNGKPTGYPTGAPQGYATGNGGGQGNHGAPAIQPPPGKGNTGAPNGGQLNQIPLVEAQKG
jgi:hypothetical protein